MSVSLALDDFGVGFFSLSEIREPPPVDAVKVDRSFTAGLGENSSDGAVVRAVLSLAEGLGPDRDRRGCGDRGAAREQHVAAAGRENGNAEWPVSRPALWG